MWRSHMTCQNLFVLHTHEEQCINSVFSFFIFQLSSRIVQILTGHLIAWWVYVVVLTNYVVNLTMAYYYYYYYPFSSYNVFSNVTLVRSLHNPLRLGIVDESWWVPSSCQSMKTSPIKEVATFFGPFWFCFGCKLMIWTKVSKHVDHFIMCPHSLVVYCMY